MSTGDPFCIHGRYAALCVMCNTVGALPLYPHQQGWLCPACGVGVAPWQPMCPACQPAPTVTSEAGEPRNG